MAEKFVQFLNKAHSVFHSIKLMEQELKEAGFVKLQENQSWKLENNRYYYVVRNDSSIIAFKIPEMIQVKSINLVVAHSDSPALKIKPVADLHDKNYAKLNVEVYGGPILSSWLDKPLSAAGRAIIKRDGRLCRELVDFDENYCVIPNVAPHHNTEINNGFKYNPQVDLVPLVSLDVEENYFKKKIASTADCAIDDIYGYDMFLYNREQALLWGKENEFVSGQRIDNLECSYAALQAFKYSYSAQSINMFVVFDNEEVGSESRQGASSFFLKEVIDRIFASFFYSSADEAAILANSFMISADNAHAVHPNHPEMYDVDNRSFMNKGIVIKRNASQRYITDGIGEAIMKTVCEKANVPYQFFTNKSDQRGGGTQASSLQQTVSIMGVDIGLPQIAMHSTYETAGSKDYQYLVDALSTFYNLSITVSDNKIDIR